MHCRKRTFHALNRSLIFQDSIKGVKEAALLALCYRSFNSGRTIIFFQTKKAAHRAKMLFGLCSLPPSGELHGDMTQTMRLESLESFRKACPSYAHRI